MVTEPFVWSVSEQSPRHDGHIATPQDLEVRLLIIRKSPRHPVGAFSSHLVATISPPRGTLRTSGVRQTGRQLSRTHGRHSTTPKIVTMPEHKVGKIVTNYVGTIPTQLVSNDFTHRFGTGHIQTVAIFFAQPVVTVSAHMMATLCPRQPHAQCPATTWEQSHPTHRTFQTHFLGRQEDKVPSKSLDTFQPKRWPQSPLNRCKVSHKNSAQLAYASTSSTGPSSHGMYSPRPHNGNRTACPVGTVLAHYVGNFLTITVGAVVDGHSLQPPRGHSHVSQGHFPFSWSNDLPPCG
jgi:hypothetical protein